MTNSHGVPTRRNELELKLVVPASFTMPKLKKRAGVSGIEERGHLELSATYFDTPDLRLLAHGITLRYRSGERPEPFWTLKLPVRGDMEVRSELEFEGAPWQPPQGVRDVLFAFLDGPPFEPVASIHTSRRRWQLSASDDGNLAELVDDDVSVFNGDDVRAKFREIEIEARDGDRSRLEKIARVIAKAGGQREQRSKLSRALDVLRGEEPAVPARSRVSPNDPAGRSVGPALEKGIRRLLLNDPFARLGDPEGVHQLRVAARRLRSVLRTFGPIIDQNKTVEAIEGVRWLGRAAGTVRDLDVLQASFAEQAGTLSGDLAPVFDDLKKRRGAAHEALLQTLSSDRYLGFIRGLKVLAEDDALTTEATKSCRIVLPKLARRSWRKLRKAARPLRDDSPVESFHAVRITAKRARYAAEAVAPFLPSKMGKRIRAFAFQAEKVQNVLGEKQDAVVARETLLEYANLYADDGRLNLALGQLMERYDMIANARRREFFDAWGKLDSARRLPWSGE